MLIRALIGKTILLKIPGIDSIIKYFYANYNKSHIIFVNVIYTPNLIYLYISNFYVVKINNSKDNLISIKQLKTMT